jgi:mannosyltransferase OCH1-like enzyme
MNKKWLTFLRIQKIQKIYQIIFFLKRIQNIKAKKLQADKIKEEANKQITKYYNLMKPYSLKPSYQRIIPLHVYTCWHTYDLPPDMKKNYELMKVQNPELEFHLYDENDCKKFIQNHFSQNVVDAYESLIPCSYKSDLWRFCVLYINGGIYIDIKYQCVNGFKLVALTEGEQFVRDYNPKNVYTALIVTFPKNNIMKQCIDSIVENVKNRYYGVGCLDPTGPGLLAKSFSQDSINSFPLFHSFTDIPNKVVDYYIVFNNKIILSFYKNYRDEQKKYQKNKKYHQLWDEKNIYK